MVTSDAHEGLRGPIQRCFPGAIWQRCHTEEFLSVHFRRNVTDRVPAAKKEQVHAMLDSIPQASSPADPRNDLEEAQMAYRSACDDLVAERERDYRSQAG